MAPSSPAESISDEARELSGSDTSDVEEGGVDIQTRAPKRRRLSEDENEDEEDSNNDDDDDDDEPIPAPAPMATVSRIKKKDPQAPRAQPAPNDANPELIRDAIEIGLHSAESSFKALNVAPWLVGSLTTMAIRKPTAIQRACIPEILKGRDCIGGSRTGSGKTVAFAVPMLQEWAKDPVGVFGLVLTPTRFVFLRCFLGGFYRLWANCVESLRCRSSNRCKPSPRHRV